MTLEGEAFERFRTRFIAGERGLASENACRLGTHNRIRTAAAGYRGHMTRGQGEHLNELEQALHAEISKRAGAEGLVAHVDQLIESHRTEKLLSTTGTAGAVGELARRNEGLEQAIRALALAVENLATADH
jgi:hypothetical protein